MGLSFCSYTCINLVFWFSLLHLTHPHFASSGQPFCHDEERSALLQFKESLSIDKSKYVSVYDFAYPKLSSWKVEEANGDCCSWDGITCNDDTGHVIKLDLTSSYLYGSLNSNSTLFHLVHLEWLSLADNDFNYSKIPYEIKNLSRLSYLDLSFSIFSGEIPSEILGFSRLVYLNLSYNIGGLELKNWGRGSLSMSRNLKVLDLKQVNINSSVPDILTTLFSLTYLSLESCGLQGRFPSKIFQLPNLYFLNVDHNSDLTGYLPIFEKNSPLQELKLAYTNFSGEIPDSIGNLQSLSYLDIRGCNFLGNIPLSLSNLTRIHFLGLSSNKFAGGLPSFISNLPSLTELHLANYSFSSQNSRSLSWIANLTKLTHLDLSAINLVGEIPTWLLNLTQLTSLEMVDNKLTGPIPSWLMNLNKLRELNLWNNQLTGYIPSEIRNLSQLSTLQLQSNLLEGPIPNSLFELKNLMYLHLGSNKLGGTLDLDVFLHELKSLEVLVLSSNNLSLLIETANYNHLQEFHVLGLGSCNLSGFPNFLRKQQHLVSLDLSSNKIVGQIPSWLLNVSINTLEYLNLSYNQLTGFDQHPIVLPWTVLATLDLRFNKLQGQLPVPSVSIHTYLVSNNQLKGDIPAWICSLNKLFALDLSYNNLSGMLPQCLGNFSDQLSILKLERNSFHGSIPKIFMHGTNLRMIDLSQNLLEGRIPRSIANCVMLEFLNLGNNQISDKFPSWLGTLPRLKVLILHKNKFHGVIKGCEINVEFPSLHIIDLSFNKFAGNLPSKYFDCWNAIKVANATSLTYMQDVLQRAFHPFFSTDYGSYHYSLTLSNKGTELEYQKLSNLVTGIILSSNKFEGEIPASIGNLRGLYNLNLSNNNFQGRIPSSLGNLTVLESLDLSRNGLSGEIPHQLAELTSLEVFDVSYNHLTGPIPQGTQFNTFENNSFDGNPGLCGKPLSKKCENSESLQREDGDSNAPFTFGWKIVVIGFGCGLIPGVILGHFFTTGKHGWFANTFGWQLKMTERKRGHRGRR